MHWYWREVKTLSQSKDYCDDDDEGNCHGDDSDDDDGDDVSHSTLHCKTRSVNLVRYLL